jgi:hypothetical protein
MRFIFVHVVGMIPCVIRLKMKSSESQEAARGARNSVVAEKSMIPVSAGDPRCSSLYLSSVLSPC